MDSSPADAPPSKSFETHPPMNLLSVNSPERVGAGILTIAALRTSCRWIGAPRFPAPWEGGRTWGLITAGSSEGFCRSPQQEHWNEHRKMMRGERRVIMPHYSHVIAFSDLVHLWVIKIKSPWSFAHVIRRDHVSRARKCRSRSENMWKVCLF